MRGKSHTGSIAENTCFHYTHIHMKRWLLLLLSLFLLILIAGSAYFFSPLFRRATHMQIVKREHPDAIFINPVDSQAELKWGIASFFRGDTHLCTLFQRPYIPL